MSFSPTADSMYERKKPKYLFMFSDWQQFLTDAMTPLIDLLKLERMETHLQKLHGKPDQPLEYFLANQLTEVLFMDTYPSMEAFVAACQSDVLGLHLVPETMIISMDHEVVNQLDTKNERLVVFGIGNELWAVTGDRRAIANHLDAERTNALEYATGLAPIKLRTGEIKELSSGSTKDIDLREFDFVMRMIMGHVGEEPGNHANVTNTQFVGVPKKVVDVHQDWPFIVLVRMEERANEKRLH